MKRFTKLFFILVALAGLVSCQDDLSRSQSIVESEVRSGGRKVRSELSVVPMFDMPQTKSVYVGSETEVKNWTLLQFDGEMPGGSGRLVAAYYQNSGSNISNIVVRADHRYDFYAVANLGDVRGEFTVGASNGTTAAELIDWVATKDYSSGSAKAITLDNVAALPMSGSQTGVKFSAEQLRSSDTHVSVSMMRLVGRYDIVVNQANLTKWSFNATSLKMQGTSAVTPFRQESGVAMSQVTGDRASAADLTELNGGRAATFYPLENCYGNLLPNVSAASGKTAQAVSAASSTATPTYVELKGVLTMTDGSDISRDVTYRFYLGNGDNATTKNFDVFRNRQHTVTVYLSDAAIDEDPYWKIEPEPFTDTRVLSFEDDVIMVFAGGSTDENIIRKVNNQPKAFQYTIELSQELTAAGIGVNVGGSAYTAGTPVDAGTITFTAPAGVSFVQGTAKIWTLDRAIHDEATVSVGKQLVGLRFGLWPDATTERFHSDTTVTYTSRSSSYEKIWPHLYADYSDGSVTAVAESELENGIVFDGNLLGRASDGYFYGKKACETTLTASFTDNGITKSATANITVLHGALTNFKIEPATAELRTGGVTQTFTPYAHYDGEDSDVWHELSATEKQDLVWSSSKYNNFDSEVELFTLDNGVIQTLDKRGKRRLRAYWQSQNMYGNAVVEVYSDLVSLEYRPAVIHLPSAPIRATEATSRWNSTFGTNSVSCEVIATYSDGYTDVVSNPKVTSLTGGEWEQCDDYAYFCHYDNPNDANRYLYISRFISNSGSGDNLTSFLYVGAAKGNSSEYGNQIVDDNDPQGTYYLNSGPSLNTATEPLAFHSSSYTYRGVTKSATLRVTADAGAVARPTKLTVSPESRTMVLGQGGYAKYVATIEFSDGTKAENVADYPGLVWSVSGNGTEFGIYYASWYGGDYSGLNGATKAYMVTPGTVVGDATVTATYTLGSTTISGTGTLHVNDPGTLLTFYVDPASATDCDLLTSYYFTCYATFSNVSGPVNVTKSTVWTVTGNHFDGIGEGYDNSRDMMEVYSGLYYSDYKIWNVTYTHGGTTLSQSVRLENEDMDYGNQTGIRLERKEGSSWYTSDASVEIGSTTYDLRCIEVYQYGEIEKNIIRASEMVTSPSDPSSMISWKYSSYHDCFTAVGTGTVSFTVHADGFTSNTITYTISNVAPPTPTYEHKLELSASPTSISVGGTSALTVTYYTREVGSSSWGSGTNVTSGITWSSLSHGSISGTTYTGTSAGTDNFTATYQGETSNQVSITVNSVAPTYEHKLELSASPTSISVGGTSALTVKYYTRETGSSDWGSGTTVTSGITWSSLSHGSISGTTYTGTSAGTDNFTATYQGETSNQVSITVSSVAPTYEHKLELSASPTSISVGGTSALMVKYYTREIGSSDWGSGTTVTSDITWSSLSHGSISGTTYTGTSAGTDNFTATYKSETSNQVSITVNAPITYEYRVTIDPGSATIAYNGSQQFTAKYQRKASNSSSWEDVSPQPSFSWSSSNTSVATVSGSGLATGCNTSSSSGNTTITASYDGKSASATLTVNGKPVTYEYRVTIDPGTATIAYNGTKQFTAMYQRKASGSSTWEDVSPQPSFTWSSSNPSAASINSSGLATGCNSSSSSASTTITASYDDKSASATLTVDGKPELVSIEVPDAYAKSWAPVNSVAYGDEIVFTCIAHYSDNSTQNVTSDAVWSIVSGPNVSNSGSVYTCTSNDISASGVTRKIRTTYGGEYVDVTLTIYPKYVVSMTEVVFNDSYRSTGNAKPKANVTYNDGSTATISAGQLDKYEVYNKNGSLVHTYDAGDDVDMIDLGTGNFSIYIYYTSKRYGSDYTVDKGKNFSVN